ncbi:hypothetical protein WDW86_18385 [Bdellovibrionota bacterium FG-2]
MKNLSLVLIGLLFSAASSWAASETPECMASGRAIAVDNGQVLKWKGTTPNQFLGRAYVEGTVTTVYPDRNGHEHFAIKIGNEPNDMLEVVYNNEFGEMPTPTVGMKVEACGDYITSTEQTEAYPPSPVGAIIHWVHKSPSKHDSGFVVLDGTLYGYSFPKSSPKKWH